MDHQQKAARQIHDIKLAVITVSDSRTLETDTNGQYLLAQADALHMDVPLYKIIPDEAQQVAELLDLAAELADVIVFNGGTGISTRDTTFDVLHARFEKPIPGFGELFRMLSYEQVGAAAMLSRAAAGIYRNRVVFCVPGSHAAVMLAWEQLIAGQIPHLIWEMRR